MYIGEKIKNKVHTKVHTFIFCIQKYIFIRKYNLRNQAVCRSHKE